MRRGCREVENLLPPPGPLGDEGEAKREGNDLCPTNFLETEPAEGDTAYQQEWEPFAVICMANRHQRGDKQYRGEHHHPDPYSFVHPWRPVQKLGDTLRR